MRDPIISDALAAHIRQPLLDMLPAGWRVGFSRHASGMPLIEVSAPGMMVPVRQPLRLTPSNLIDANDLLADIRAIIARIEEVRKR